MKRVYDYLELYKNSHEVKVVLAPYDILLSQIADEIARVKDACFLESSDAAGLKRWLKLYNPPECDKLSDKQRVHDALSFFAGAPVMRIQQIAARASGCDMSEVFITENENRVYIALPEQADFVPDVYLNYLESIKPAHVLLSVYRRRTHAEMTPYTHEQLKQYTHAGLKKEESE